MRSNRRKFLQLSVYTGAWLLFGVRGRAHGFATAAQIHQGTRNTVLGAIGAGLRKLRTPLPPYKPYAGRERIALGAVATTPARSLATVLGGDLATHGSAGLPAPRLSRATLGRLLYFANGDTGKGDDNPYKLRAAPSAGALYAGELYVVARNVAGLKPGVYCYDVGRHALVLVRSRIEHDGLAAAFAHPGVAQAPALILLTNVFARYERRYANRGYRYALIDSGHIGENLRLAAASAGLPEMLQSEFDDDRLNRLLAIDGREEAVCAVHALGCEADDPAAGKTAVRQLREKGDKGASALPDDATPTQRYHEASKLVAVSESSDSAAGSDAVADAATTGGAAVAHAPGTSLRENVVRSERGSVMLDRETVEHHIAERRSARAFRREPIERVKLASLLEVAAAPKRLGRKAGAVDLQVIVHRVADAEPGIYRYEQSRHALTLARRQELSEAVARACLGQGRAADAAAVVLMVGRIEEAVGRGGQRAYRDLLIEAGEIAQRVYLGAQALGLAARNLAAYYDDALNRLVGLDGRRLAVVHLTVVGLEE